MSKTWFSATSVQDVTFLASCLHFCVFFHLGNPVASHPSSLLKLQHLWLMEIIILGPKRNFNKNIVGKDVKSPCSLHGHYICTTLLQILYALWECTSEMFKVPNSHFQNIVGNIKKKQNLVL